MFSNYYHNIPLHAFFYRWKYNKHLIYYTIKLILPLSNVCFTKTCVGENVWYLFLYTCTNDELRAYAKIVFLLLYPLTHIILQYWQLHMPTLSETFFNIYISVNRVELYPLIVYLQALNIKTYILMVYYISYPCIYMIIFTCGVAWLG